jgi:protoporphyrin/coproporphyrin ferrochelatase
MSKRAVLLLAHGTPESVEQVPEYLRNVVSGRPVPAAVVKEIAHRYALIGKSPLTEITLEQARLVEEELNAGSVSHPGGKDTGIARVRRAAEGQQVSESASQRASGDAHPSDKNKNVARVGHPIHAEPSKAGVDLCFPRSENPDLHPTDEDLSVGTPDLGHPNEMGLGHPVRVYVGMRNWKPYIADVVKQMRADGVEEAAVICMAPQNSRTSVGLYRRAVEAEAQGLRIDFTEGWARHPLLVEAFAERLRPAWRKLSEDVGFPVPVLFTAHSVPKRTVEPEGGDSLSHPSDKDKDVSKINVSGVGQPAQGQQVSESASQRASDEAHPSDKNKDVARVGHPGEGVARQPHWPGKGADPYAEEARHTAELVAERVPEIPSWRFAFQSQGASGGAWIGPSVEETLDAMAQEGVKAVMLQPIGFLCDHVEILFDVDRLFREYAVKLGIRLERPESLNASRTLARAVADLARQGLARLAG